MWAAVRACDRHTCSDGLGSDGVLSTRRRLRQRLVLPILLSVTVLGTMCNNIVNVPLRLIADDFDAPLSSAVLCVSAFVLPLAVAVPVGVEVVGADVGRAVDVHCGVAVAPAAAAPAVGLPIARGSM